MKTYFGFDTAQQKGVFFLVIFMLFAALFMLWFFQKTSLPDKKRSNAENQIQAFIDSVKQQDGLSAQDTVTLPPFNPNFLTDYRGYLLGLSPEEINRVQDYRNTGKWINSAREFQEVSRVSDTLLSQISPYFKFPEWVNSSTEASRPTRQSADYKISQLNKKDLNRATEAELQEIKGVGEVLSRRIVRYRNSIGHFLDAIQLKDVYGLNGETRQNILAVYTVPKDENHQQMDLNEVSVQDLMHVPYFDYEVARRIVDYRITHEGIKSFEELTKIEGFPHGRMDRLKLYLKIEE